MMGDEESFNTARKFGSREFTVEAQRPRLTVEFESDLACPEDLDGTGDVGFSDLLRVLTNWGPCAGCPEDLDMNGDVGFSDLLDVLTAWGPCP